MYMKLVEFLVKFQDQVTKQKAMGRTGNIQLERSGVNLCQTKFDSKLYCGSHFPGKRYMQLWYGWYGLVMLSWMQPFLVGRTGVRVGYPKMPDAPDASGKNPQPQFSYSPLTNTRYVGEYSHVCWSSFPL